MSDLDDRGNLCCIVSAEVYECLYIVLSLATVSVLRRRMGYLLPDMGAYEDACCVLGKILHYARYPPSLGTEAKERERRGGRYLRTS